MLGGALKVAFIDDTDRTCGLTEGPAIYTETGWLNHVSNRVGEKQKLPKEWKNGNKSKEIHLQTNIKARTTVYQVKCKAELKRFGNVIQRVG